MAIIAMGVFLSSVIRSNFTSEVEHSIHSFWYFLFKIRGYISYAAETIIFFMVGIIVGFKIIKVYFIILIALIFKYKRRRLLQMLRNLFLHASCKNYFHDYFP